VVINVIAEGQEDKDEPPRNKRCPEPAKLTSRKLLECGLNARGRSREMCENRIVKELPRMDPKDLVEIYKAGALFYSPSIMTSVLARLGGSAEALNWGFEYDLNSQNLNHRVDCL